MSIPTIKIGDGNWAVKPSLLLGYNDANGIYIPREFTVSRVTTGTEINSAGNLIIASNNIARIDYLNFTKGALLVEPSGQNLAWQSAGFEVSGTWVTSNISVSTGTTAAFTAPDGSTDADLFTESTDVSTTNHQISQSINTVVVSGNNYTFSGFFKATSANRSVRLAISSALFVGSPQCFFDVTNGTVGTSTDCTGRIDNYGSGWYRCAMTATCDVSGTATVFISSASGNARDYIGNGSASLYAWGAQLEVGSVATTYIPTTSGSVTRNADVISASGALVSGLIGQTEGTLYAEVDVRNLTDGRILMLFNTVTRYILLSKSTNRLGGAVIDTTSIPTTVVLLQTASGSLTAGTYKLALAYAVNDFAFYVNGTQVGTSASGNVIGGYTSARLGHFDSSFFLNDRIRAVALYTTRLSNDQLSALTKL